MAETFTSPENVKDENSTLIFQWLKRKEPIPLSVNIQWNSVDTGQITCIYFEVKNSSLTANTTFHAFLYNCNKKEHELPIRFDPDIHNYTLAVYGLQRCNGGRNPCYRICANAKLDMATMTSVSGDKSGFGVALVNSSDYFPLYTSAQESHTAGIRHIDKTDYELVGLEEFDATIIIIKQTSPPVTYILKRQSPQNNKFRAPLSLKAATNHSICIHEVTYTNKLQTMVTFFSSRFTKIEDFTTYMTEVELRVLFEKATRFVGTSGSVCLEYFYRNKPAKYFHEIFNYYGGIMVPYVKDKNGDRASVINGNIDGLFFSAAVDRYSRPPPKSYFGGKRLFALSSFLFHKNRNLYFADFYCHFKHHVTLVLTEDGSTIDIFCRNRLLRLNIYDNPFLHLVPFMRETRVYVTLGVKVEVFFTEKINLHHLRALQGGFLFQDVPVLGRGSSRKDGIPKNPNCTICNL